MPFLFPRNMYANHQQGKNRCIGLHSVAQSQDFCAEEDGGGGGKTCGCSPAEIEGREVRVKWGLLSHRFSYIRAEEREREDFWGCQKVLFCADPSPFPSKASAEEEEEDEEDLRTHTKNLFSPSSIRVPLVPFCGHTKNTQEETQPRRDYTQTTTAQNMF